MSIQHPFSPDGQGGDDENAGGAQRPRHTTNQTGNQTARGHAAYAAQDGETRLYFNPSQSSPGSGLGPIGGLYADDPAAPTGHGVLSHKEEERPAPMPLEALQAECAARICPACAVKKEADDVRLRSLAELENARKRLTRERDEHVRFAAEAVLADVTPAIDNLDLALQHAGDNEACRNFVMGVQMTRKLLLEALQKHGLEQVGRPGEAFDPAIHEAVGTDDAPDVPDGHVCALLSTGYKLKDRLLRPARVMVCKK